MPLETWHSSPSRGPSPPGYGHCSERTGWCTRNHLSVGQCMCSSIWAATPIASPSPIIAWFHFCETDSHFSLARLRSQQRTKSADSFSRWVPAPLPAASTPQRVRAHPELRIPRQPQARHTPATLLSSAWFQHRRQNKTYQTAKPQVLLGYAQNAVHRWWSSKDSPLLKSSFVLLPPWSPRPHETTLHHKKSLRVSARSVSPRLAIPQTAPFYFLKPCFGTTLALSSTFQLPLSSVLLFRHNLGASPHRTCPQLDLHKARLRRNHGRLPSNGFIESAPEHRARAHSAWKRASDKALTFIRI